MSTVDKVALLEKLNTELKENYQFGSTDVGDILSLSLSAQALDTNNIIVVDSIDSLPNLIYFDSPSGMLYFVNNIGIFAINSGMTWITLDGRLLRTDTDYSILTTWGNNYYGQLGDSTTVNKSSPVLVGGFTDWCQVSASVSYYSFNLGVRTNGTAWAWGKNYSGQLGNGSGTDASSPVLVTGGFTDWCQVSAGSAYYGVSLGVRTNGTVWAWGSNKCGALGTGNTIDSRAPVSVVGGFTDWCQVSSGYAHSLGLRTNGSVWAWGGNDVGQLGDGTTVNKSSPVSVIGGFSDWCQVTTGYAHGIGLRANGSVWAWGCNCKGQLGNGTTVDRSSPVSVVGGFTDWCQVSAGYGHSLGLRTNGTAWAWGINYGELGDGTTVNKSSPVSVIGGFTDWCQVSAGWYNSLGLRTNGTAWAWGYNRTGQLGDGTTINKSSPVSVAGGFTNWCQVSAGIGSLGIQTT